MQGHRFLFKTCKAFLNNAGLKYSIPHKGFVAILAAESCSSQTLEIHSHGNTAICPVPVSCELLVTIQDRLSHLQVKRNSTRVPDSVTQIYRALLQHIGTQDLEEQHQFRSLETEQCIWTGSCFTDPGSAVIAGDQSLAPALYSLEQTLASNFTNLLILLKVDLGVS